MSSRQLSVIPAGTNQGPFYGNVYGDVPSRELSHLDDSQEFKPANRVCTHFLRMCVWGDATQTNGASRVTLSICGANPASISQCWRTTLHCTPLSDVPTPRAGESGEDMGELATELFSITKVRNRILDTRFFVRDTECVSGGQHKTTWKVPLGTWVSGGHQITIGGGSISTGPSSCQGYQLELKTELLETFPRWGVQIRAVPRIEASLQADLTEKQKARRGRTTELEVRAPSRLLGSNMYREPV